MLQERQKKPVARATGLVLRFRLGLMPSPLPDDGRHRLLLRHSSIFGLPDS
jgi:hypothetical protein